MRRASLHEPLGTLRRVVMRRGSPPTTEPISEAKVSPQQHANDARTAMLSSDIVYLR